MRTEGWCPEAANTAELFLFNNIIVSRKKEKKMTFVKILIISLLCYTKWIDCQSAKPETVWFKDFFNYNIKVDYSTCEHSFYSDESYEDYESDSDYGGDDYGGDDYSYEDEICLRYFVMLPFEQI